MALQLISFCALLSVALACGGSSAPPIRASSPANIAAETPPQVDQTPAAAQGVRDRGSGVLWHAQISERELTIEEATAHCAAAGAGWRLPNKAELASMYVGEDDAQTLKPELAAGLPNEGALWSGEDVSDERAGQTWLVNLHNGHIFNGHGRVGYARCVYGAALIPEPIAIPNDVPYDASLGPASATTTLILYCQYDYPCNKLRPILQKLLAERSIRIEWNDWAIWDTFEHYSLASCAAARQGSFPAMHQRLWQAAKTKVDAAGVRRMAGKLGLDLDRFDADVAGPCRTVLEAHDQQAQSLGLPGTPTLIIGETRLNPLAQPDELERAIEQLPE